MYKRAFEIAFAVLIGASGVVFSFATPADAACRQVLAPNRWQYVTVCSGYSGATDYSGAIAAGITAGALAIEVLPDVLGTVGNITSSFGDITSGAVNTLGDVTTNVAAPLNQAATEAPAFNPFSIFSPQPDVPCNQNDRKRGCRNIKGNAAAFGANNTANDQQYVVDPGGCSANDAVFGRCQKKKAVTRCNASGCYVEYVAVPQKKEQKQKPSKQNARAGTQSSGSFAENPVAELLERRAIN